ncbi:MAG: fatty acid kinase, partial [Solirubrobacteraceae bacterium]|nr:fatty acid kinase [Solirubrobacteraceae bacterium]
MALDPSLVRFRAVVEGALAALEARRQEINDLNVFPVADGDTGDNMALTLRAVVDELARLEEQGPVDEIGRDQIVESVARAALLGARGNSGVILSQLVRGAAQELISRPGKLVDPELVAAALSRAADAAYRSVREPAEGTILTVAREMGTDMSSLVAHLPDAEVRLPVSGDADLQNRLIANVLESALATGEQSLKRGPELLPILRQAGVVDAGAYGLLVVLSGVLGVLRGDETPQLEHHAPAKISHPQHASSTFRYCTNFAVTGTALDSSYFIPLLEQIGDSVLVVGDRATLKVHVHTNDPERATAIFAEHGSVSRLDVADMREQMVARAERLAAAAPDSCGVLAVVSGDGMAEMFLSVGATPLDGGPTLNPSTYELLAGVHSAPAEEVVVLPNSANVRMAAERAAELSDKHVRVVPSRSQQAGLAAAVALDPHRGAAPNAEAMREALEAVKTGAVTEAARDDGEARFRAGDAIGFVEEIEGLDFKEAVESL